MDRGDLFYQPESIGLPLELLAWIDRPVGVIVEAAGTSTYFEGTLDRVTFQPDFRRGRTGDLMALRVGQHAFEVNFDDVRPGWDGASLTLHGEDLRVEICPRSWPWLLGDDECD